MSGRRSAGATCRSGHGGGERGDGDGQRQAGRTGPQRAVPDTGLELDDEKKEEPAQPGVAGVDGDGDEISPGELPGREDQVETLLRAESVGERPLVFAEIHGVNPPALDMPRGLAGTHRA